MIAVDTDVLLRYLLHDDADRAALADAVFDAAEAVLITDVALMETVRTLAGRKYRLVRPELVAVLERLFGEPNIRFEDDQVVWRALQAYRNAAPVKGGRLEKEVGFAVTLIVFKALRVASTAGEELNAVYTFDVALQNLPRAESP